MYYKKILVYTIYYLQIWYHQHQIYISKLQRLLGQITGTCFQRCVGMDALNSIFSTTYDIDIK